MARPKKNSLDYFPFDVDFFEDEKIVCIAGEFGIKGEITTVKLLCAIYRNGYFIEWNDVIKMKLLRSLPGISLDLLNVIVTRLVKWGFFDPNLFSTATVLTSKGIQKRYREAMKRCAVTTKKKDYWLLDDVIEDGEEIADFLVNVAKTIINVAETLISAAKTQQNKGDNMSPKGDSKKIKKSFSLQHRARLIFEKYFFDVYGQPYYYAKKDAGALKQLLNKIRYSRENRPSPLPVDDESMLSAFESYIKSIDDNWVNENFSIAVLNSKYNEIISKLKSNQQKAIKSNGSYTNRLTDAEVAKQKRDESYARGMQELLANPDPERPELPW